MPPDISFTMHGRQLKAQRNVRRGREGAKDVVPESRGKSDAWYWKISPNLKCWQEEVFIRRKKLLLFSIGHAIEVFAYGYNITLPEACTVEQERWKVEITCCEWESFICHQRCMRPFPIYLGRSVPVLHTYVSLLIRCGGGGGVFWRIGASFLPALSAFR